MTTEFEVELVQAFPDRSSSLRLRVPAGATVADALALALAAGFAPAAEAEPACLAIFGRAATKASALREGDRIELLRPLLVDPKQRRRDRAGERRN